MYNTSVPHTAAKCPFQMVLKNYAHACFTTHSYPARNPTFSANGWDVKEAIEIKCGAEKKEIDGVISVTKDNISTTVGCVTKTAPKQQVICFCVYLFGYTDDWLQFSFT